MLGLEKIASEVQTLTSSLIKFVSETDTTFRFELKLGTLKSCQIFLPKISPPENFQSKKSPDC